MEQLLFTDVRLFDGSGKASFAADVAVKDDRIAEVAPAGTLKKTGSSVVDGKGLALTPGFVDVHSHSDARMIQFPGGDSKISQGITTDISGNCGFSQYLADVDDNDLEEHTARCRGNFSAYAEVVEQAQGAMNSVHLCGHNSLREYVMGFDERKPTREEMRQMKELLADALANGAAGFSSGLVYLPGRYADTEELKELASLLKGTGKPYATHIRSEGNTLLESLKESIEIARAGDSNLVVSHFKTSGEANWHKLDAAFEIIEKAQESGMDILADRYPYIYSCTTLSIILPEPYNKLDNPTLCGRLKNESAFRKELAEALKIRCTRDWSRILIVDSMSEKHAPWFGMSMTQIAGKMNCHPAEAAVAILAEGISPGAAFGTMCEENLERILSKPYVMPGSDANIRAYTDGGTHPRAFGTMPWFYRIAAKHDTPESVIRRMSALPCAKFNLANRGIIAPGYFADLVLLDLDNFSSPADYGYPNQKARGVERVYVNGQLAYAADEEMKIFRPGRMLRIK